ncbi:hypothetical protein [uncultured Vibrio sp.]|uniref:hypothetical protein n=1 Tax=Vibrio sp. TaxID=678 RepID=UPI0029C8A25D|nr:hypothetical protein [uncultured Vibrio sp.]
MRKIHKLASILGLGITLNVPAFAANHLMEFKAEKRGSDFERHFAELHSSWGMQGVGLLGTTLELNGTTWFGHTVTHIHPGFTYMIPVVGKFYAGPVMKYDYVVDKDDALKSGLGWAYAGFKGIKLAGQFRYDYQLGDDGFDLVRTDVLAGFPITGIGYLTATFTNMNPLEGPLSESWQELEMEFKYTGFSGIHPYVATTITSDSEPLGQGDDAYIIGLYIPFS